MDYLEFLETKKQHHINSGFEIKEDDLNTHLFDFQKYITKTALQAGKYAVFADCGLGKTIIQLEWAHRVSLDTGKPVLILCPLAVSGQTIKEGEKFSIPVHRYDGSKKEIQITNYEQLENIDCELFSGIVLDESSILKNFTGHYKNLIIEKFKTTPYKLACTATPSPNDLNEIGNHSEFLDILDAQDMRSKWFVRDEGMNNYRLKGHAKKDFYGWISSWACMLTKPSDLGFELTGEKFKLPKLRYIEHEIITDLKLGNGRLFNEGHVNATNFNAELRGSKEQRLQKAIEIANQTKGQVIIWVKQNEEGDYLRKYLTDCKEVKGSDTNEYKEKTLLSFANGDFKVLITKAKIAQFGMNFQNCHVQVFPSLDFSFESFYQQVRRSYRFGQKHNVEIHLIKTDTMENVVKTVEKKERQFFEMQTEMNKNINSERYGLINDYDRKVVQLTDALLIKGDSCIEVKTIPDNSVDLIVFSPPFSSLFTYSNYIHDMGNNENHEEFFKQYAYLLKDLYRILKPGRLMCCHTKDLGVYKNSSGYTGQYDFTGEHTKSVLNEGFKLHSKITIWTDPVLEMQRTKTQRLLYKQVTSDSSKTGVGMAEYITVFKKWDGSDEEQWEPITNLTKQNFDLDTWQEWASPVFRENLISYDKGELVQTILAMKAEIFELKYGCNTGLPAHFYSDVWFDIQRTDVLNGKEGTDLGDEKHIAPLQLEIIHRIVNMWSNPGEVVFTPFLGIGSEAYVAIKNSRKAIGIELKDSYFDTAVKNVRNAEVKKTQLKLF